MGVLSLVGYRGGRIHAKVVLPRRGAPCGDICLRKLTYFNEVDRGGHFAMWEHPELFAVELRAAFKPLR
jgi:hypothetical protein